MVVDGQAQQVENCPECHAGKCGNCDGKSWDKIKDQPGICPCWLDGHKRRTA